jgi:hypothetical protein
LVCERHLATFADGLDDQAGRGLLLTQFEHMFESFSPGQAGGVSRGPAAQGFIGQRLVVSAPGGTATARAAVLDPPRLGHGSSWFLQQ